IRDINSNFRKGFWRLKVRKREFINSSSSTTRSIMNKGDVTSASGILVFVVVIGIFLFMNNNLLQGAIQI
ncbi:MAG TPA: hypothetical protein VJU85_00430, partial [Nitrososphaeraceae archaeon]|nr:hypothetical protein [Nitrososphaeraceae archaeon]